jgi:hypothetical protein
MKSDWCVTHNNPAKGAKQKCMHYINYFHYYHYLLEQKSEKNEKNLIYKGIQIMINNEAGKI